MIAGFRSLAHDVDRRGGVICSSYSQLATAIDEAARRREVALNRMTDEASVTLPTNTLGLAGLQMNDSLQQTGRAVKS